MIEYQGKMYARVSEILKPFTNFSHIDPAVLENKARIGTEVHKAIAEDLPGNFPVLSEDCMGYFESYLKWKDASEVSLRESEQRYYCSSKMITGQIDALFYLPKDCLNPESAPTLIDFKTSASESKETWPMQAHLYHYLLSKNAIMIHPIMFFVKLDKLGNLPQVFLYTFRKNTLAKCLIAIDDFWSKNKSTSD